MAKRVSFEDARSLGRDLAATLYRWWSGEEVRPRSGGARHLADLWGARAHELMESGVPATLLAPATCDRGTLDAAVLLTRLGSLPGPPLEWDAQQALLRLDPGALDDPTLVALLEKAGLAQRPGGDVDIDIQRALGSRSRVSYGAMAAGDTTEALAGPPGWALLLRPPRVTENLESRSRFHPAELVRSCAPWHPRLVAAHLVPVIAGQVLHPEAQLDADTGYILALTGLIGTPAGALGACLALSAKHADQRAAAVDVITDGLLNGTADVNLLSRQLQRVTASGDAMAGRLARSLGPLLTDPALGPPLCRLVRTAVVSMVRLEPTARRAH